MLNTPPTLDDVAKLAGVSKSTVSRVLSAPKGSRATYSAATKERIRDAALKLDYQPSKLARGLTMAHTGIIGFVVPTFTDFFFPMVISAIEARLVEAGYSVILADSNSDSAVEQAKIRDLLAWRVDGLIIAPSQSTGQAGLYWDLWRREIPFVTVDRTFPDTPFCSVVTDDKMGMALAVKHLIASGRKRIARACGSPSTVSTNQSRQAGYTSALLEHGLLPAPEYSLDVAALEAGGRQAVERMLTMAPRPDAVACFSDYVAFGVLEACAGRGLRVPEDLAITGYADVLQSSMLKTSLTTVRQPYSLLGRRAADLLLTCMEKKNHSEQVVLPVELIVRESTGGPHPHPRLPQP